MQNRKSPQVSHNDVWFIGVDFPGISNLYGCKRIFYASIGKFLNSIIQSVIVVTHSLVQSGYIDQQDASCGTACSWIFLLRPDKRLPDVCCFFLLELRNRKTPVHETAWIKLVGLLIAAVILPAASTRLLNLTNEIWTTFPSQFIVGDTYILKSHEKIDGNIVGIGTTLILEENALVMGDISLIGSNLEVDGRIAGDLNILAGSALIKDTAIITGNINQFFQTIDIRPKALVTGEINTYTFPSDAGGQAGTKITQLIEWLRPGNIAAFQGRECLGLSYFSDRNFPFKTPTTRVISALE